MHIGLNPTETERGPQSPLPVESHGTPLASPASFCDNVRDGTNQSSAPET